MQVEIRHQPSYSVAVVALGSGETVRAEGGAMLATTAGLTLETKAQGGFLKSLARSVLTQESFFLNTWKAPSSGGELLLAPSLPGDIAVLDIDAQPMLVHSGGYLGSSESVEVDSSWGGAKSFFGSGNLFMLRLSGSGQAIVSTYGAMFAVDLAAGQTYTVDTGFLVAFHESMAFKIRKVGGLKSLFLSGEGLVCDLTGPGRVVLQTRSFPAFIEALQPFLPKPSGN